MAKQFTHVELLDRLNSPGWQLTGERPGDTVSGTLHDVLTESHARRAAGGHPGKIEQIKTAIELEMFQIEQLWQHLGLPTI